MTKLALALSAVSLLVSACTDGPGPDRGPGPATAISCGTADDAIANQLGPRLDGSMAGRLTGDAVACARAIAQATRDYGLDECAAQIAITTAIAESSLVDLTIGDGDHVGLYQQRVSEGWGVPAQLTDPVFATDALLDRMVVAFPDDSWQTASLGVVAQTVLDTASPDEFGAQSSDGGVLASALWSTVSGER